MSRSVGFHATRSPRCLPDTARAGGRTGVPGRVFYAGSMKFGFVVPWADAEDIGDMAAEAEAAGWDGLFVWEPVWGVDAWIALGLAAVRTTRIRLGTLLTPPSRRRPWELASQVATVDRISGGRVILSIGLGAIESGFEAFGEECDRRRRAELMDECMDIVTGLWSGQPFEYAGRHYTVSPIEFPALGHTIQQPRVPVWCVGVINKQRSMDRALRWDGLLPQVIDENGAREATLDEIAAVRQQVGDRDYDIIVEGEGSQHSPAAWADAGATWWIESMWSALREASAVTAAIDRLREGPPAL
jgi:alkanesulfonate monooxygenase SsuD/methylene tetrahydromethanopterin reductase-like flavin-dependent oxidoreductase (luciferase family)